MGQIGARRCWTKRIIEVVLNAIFSEAWLAIFRSTHREVNDIVTQVAGSIAQQIIRLDSRCFPIGLIGHVDGAIRTRDAFDSWIALTSGPRNAPKIQGDGDGWR